MANHHFSLLSFLLLLLITTTSTSSPPTPTRIRAPTSSPIITNVPPPLPPPTIPITTTIIVPTPPPTPINSTCTPSSTPKTTTITPPPSPPPTSATPPPPPVTNTTTITRPPPPPPPSQPPKQVFPLDHQEQLNNILEALIGAGDFNSWVNAISASDLSTLPLSATFFVPTDDSSPTPTSATIMDPFIFPYHIVPQRLSFSDLLLFKTFSRLPTLLLSKSILITNNSFSNFTLDASLLSHPDLYTTSAFAVHGIANLLDYSVYGDSAPKPPKHKVNAQPPLQDFTPDYNEEEMIGKKEPHQRQSDAVCLCSNEFWTVLFVLCLLLASKIPRMGIIGN